MEGPITEKALHFTCIGCPCLSEKDTIQDEWKHYLSQKTSKEAKEKPDVQKHTLIVYAMQRNDT